MGLPQSFSWGAHHRAVFYVLRPFLCALVYLNGTLLGRDYPGMIEPLIFACDKTLNATNRFHTVHPPGMHTLVSFCAAGVFAEGMK